MKLKVVSLKSVKLISNQTSVFFAFKSNVEIDVQFRPNFEKLKLILKIQDNVEEVVEETTKRLRHYSEPAASRRR